MSNFYCETCGAAVIDSPTGYVEGCEHYPPDVKNNDAKSDIEILAQWIVDLDAGKFEDANDCEYISGVDAAKNILSRKSAATNGPDVPTPNGPISS